MYIHSLTLRGIKSYRKECTITFKEGINFIAGKNGAGKTTIIESIGYLLFWIRPYQYKELLATGEKEGYLSITFRGNDERMYRISRALRKDKCKYVTLEDLQTGQILEGEDVVREKIFHIHNLYSLEHLEELFLEIVAVAQGKFTAPFLENGMEKKRKFERMFGLETYEEAYKLSSPLPGIIKDQISTLNTEIADIAGRISTQAEEEAKKKSLEEQLELNSKELKKKTKLLKEQQAHFTKEQKKKSQLEQMKEKLETLRNEYKLLSKEKEHLEKSIQEATISEKICTQHKEAHLLYSTHEKEKNALHEELEALRKIEEEDQELKARQAAIESTIRLLTTQINELETELGKQHGRYQTSVGKEKATEAESSLKEASASLQTLKQETFKTTALRQDLLLLSAWESKQQIYKEKKVSLEREIASFSMLTEEERTLNAKKELMQESKRQSDELTTLRTINEAELEKCTLDSISCTSACPTCGSTGDFSTHFTEKKLLLEAKATAYKETQHTLMKILQEQPLLEKEENLLQQKKEQVLTLSLQLKEVETALKETPAFSNIFQELYTQIPEKQTLEILIQTREKNEAEQELAWKTKEKEALVFLEGLRKEQEFMEKQHLFMEEKKALLLGKKEELTAQTHTLTTLEEQRKNLASTLQVAQKHRKALQLHTSAMQTCQEAHRLFLAHEQTARKVPLLEETIQHKELLMKEQRALGEEMRKEFEIMEKDFSQEQYTLLEKTLQESLGEIRIQEHNENHLKTELKILEAKLTLFAEYAKNQEEKKAQKEKKEKQLRRLECVRTIFNTAAEPISARFRSLLSEKAALFFRRLSPEPSMLSWGEQFEVFLMKDKDHIRRFQQLSGGEQMIAALAIRLALMRYVSPFSIGFFDEPTQNLDETHRRNLASLLPHVLDGFTQLFLISHDDTFDSLTEHVIMLEKTEEGTQVVG